jgi:hypothetical protein
MRGRVHHCAAHLRAGPLRVHEAADGYYCVAPDLFVTSILSGQLISRYGRYKPFPIIGTAIMNHIPAQANPEVVKHLPAAVHTPYTP